MKIVKTITTFNGTVLEIFEDDGEYFVMVRSMYESLGYKGACNLTTSIFGASMRKSTPPVIADKRPFAGNACMLVKFLDCFRLLEKFIELRSQNPMPFALTSTATKDTVVDNAAKLLEQFQRLDLSDSKPVVPLVIGEDNKTLNKDKAGRENMNKNVTVLTEADIEDIGKRADLIKNVFDIPKSLALQATVKLKAEEMCRNLEILIEVLNKK